VSDQSYINSPEYMLTTVDNPFDPFTEFDEWLEYDIRSGYNTLSMLDRVARVPSDLPEPDQDSVIQQAIDEIATENVSGMWRKVTKDSIKDFLRKN
jgi:hypothetical protein